VGINKEGIRPAARQNALSLGSDNGIADAAGGNAVGSIAREELPGLVEAGGNAQPAQIVLES